MGINYPVGWKNRVNNSRENLNNAAELNMKGCIDREIDSSYYEIKSWGFNCLEEEEARVIVLVRDFFSRCSFVYGDLYGGGLFLIGEPLKSFELLCVRFDLPEELMLLFQVFYLLIFRVRQWNLAWVEGFLKYIFFFFFRNKYDECKKVAIYSDEPWSNVRIWIFKIKSFGILTE